MVTAQRRRGTKRRGAASPNDDGPGRITRSNRHGTATRFFKAIPRLFRPRRRDARLNGWVIRWILLCGLIGGLAGWAMLELYMVGHPHVFVETWSEGIVISPSLPVDSQVDLVRWVRAGNRADDSDQFIEIGPQKFRDVYAGLDATDTTAVSDSSSGGMVRSFRASAGCQIRIGFVPDTFAVRRVEMRVQPMLARPCVVTSELDPPTSATPGVDGGEWGPEPGEVKVIGPDTLLESQNAVLRFFPDPVPMRTARLAIDGVGFGSTDRGATASLIHGGVLRLTTFMSEGEDEVRVLGRELGRGHPIHRGDQVQLNELEDAEILQLEIGELIHVQMTGKAPHPTIAGGDKEPSLLAWLNDQHQLLWVFGFALGLMAVVGAIIEAAR